MGEGVEPVPECARNGHLTRVFCAPVLENTRQLTIPNTFRNRLLGMRPERGSDVRLCAPVLTGARLVGTRFHLARTRLFLGPRSSSTLPSASSTGVT